MKQKVNVITSKLISKLPIYSFLLFFCFIFSPASLVSTIANPKQDKRSCCDIINKQLVYYCEVRTHIYTAHCVMHCYRNVARDKYEGFDYGDKRIDCGYYTFSIPCCTLLKYQAKGMVCDYQDACDEESETYFKYQMGGCEGLVGCSPDAYDFSYDRCDIEVTISGGTYEK